MSELTHVPVGAEAGAGADRQGRAALEAELRATREALERTTRELEETNRGVLALYAELDDAAKQLRAGSDLKSRFLSNVSHELRTPLASVLNISRLLLDTPGGLAGEEQVKQVGFIRSAAQSLFDIVNDLLDLAKIEAGRVDVRAAPVSLDELFANLRGVLRPLLPSEAVALVVEEPPADLALVTDEGKLAQILRNVLSNALKFTERGEVRLSVARAPRDAVAFTVSDTGIGIAPEQQARVFEEFAQLEGPLQRRVKGTGLGLPLSRELARLLGGTLALASAPARGTTLTLVLPRTYEPPLAPPEGARRG